MTGRIGRDWERAHALLPILIDIAKTGREPITYGGVAELFGTGPRNIHGDLLGKIDTLCKEQGLPHLRTLVVLAGDGLPSGDWAGFTTPEEKRAAQAECYRHFGSLAPESVSRLHRRGNSRSASQDPVSRASCPQCHLELPATGICDDCA